MIQFLIADDHFVVRLGIRTLLEIEFPGARIGEAASAADVRREVAAGSWDIVILDIDMPGADGLSLLRELRRARPDLPVFVMSAYPEDEYASAAYTAGAACYLMKETEPAEIAEALRAVLAGRKYVSGRFARTLGARRAAGATRAAVELSEREAQVLDAIAEGRSLKEIGAHIGISAKTVTTYRARLLEKLGAHSNADLVRYALKHRIIRDT